MRIAIAGAGAVGMHIAIDLAQTGHDILVLEKDPDVVSQAPPTESVEWRLADACEASALRNAKLDEVDVVVAATGDDEDNLVISLLAKQEFGVPRVLARVNHPRNGWLFDRTWGVDVAVSTPSLITALVEEAVSVGRLVELLPFDGGRFHLVEVRLPGTATVVGKRLDELELPSDTAIVAVLRQDDGLVLPRADTKLVTGDEVVALVSEDSEAAVRTLLEADTRT